MNCAAVEIFNKYEGESLRLSILHISLKKNFFFFFSGYGTINAVCDMMGCFNSQERAGGSGYVSISISMELRF